MKRLILGLLLITIIAAFSCTMQAKKKVNRKKATTENLAGLTPLERKIVGKHLLTLQWISWKGYGSVVIKKEADGTLSCRGGQVARDCYKAGDVDDECYNNGDYIKLDGTIEIIDETHLVFTGDIRQKIYHMNNGEEILRQGTYNFVQKENRHYWRMQEMTNPVDECVDYIDIYFKR